VGSFSALAELTVNVGEGKIRDPETMITGRIGLKDAVAGGFEALLLHKDQHVKILIDPSAA
jgi:hypothetical protein